MLNNYIKKNPGLLTTFNEKKGTVIDAKGLHRGKPIKKNKRFALTNYYYTKKIGGKNFKHI